jgi:hypothetical protein
VEQNDEIWDGEAGDYTYPLDWEMDSVEGEDLSLAFMDAIEENCTLKVQRQEGDHEFGKLHQLR